MMLNRGLLMSSSLQTVLLKQGGPDERPTRRHRIVDWEFSLKRDQDAITPPQASDERGENTKGLDRYAGRYTALRQIGLWTVPSQSHAHVH